MFPSTNYEKINITTRKAKHRCNFHHLKMDFQLIGECILVQMFRISLNAKMFRNNALSNFDNLCS